MFTSKKNPKKIQDAKVKANAKRQKRERFNHVWWLPLIALLMVSYITVTHFTTRGTLVTISFKTAEGLEINKTKVKYKDVIIGKVESIKLNDDFEGVKVGVRMSRDAENLLRKDTRFWIVKPKLTVTQVTGLNTLISGFYITLDPGKTSDSEYQYEFKGLENAPVLTQEETGLNIVLLSARASAFKQGTAVYYKGYTVGKVNKVSLSEDYQWVKAEVSIESPHHKLIKPNTRFWSSNGIAITADSEGLEVQMESLETLVAGGITFGTPETSYDLGKVENGQEFRVYNNEEEANEKSIGNTYSFVTYFDGSIQGLDEDAPVTVQGIKVGKVKSIQLLFDEKLVKPLTPVIFEVYEESFHLVSHKRNNGESDNENNQLTSIERTDIKELVERLLKRGLRAQLNTSSIITGKKHLALVFDEKSTQEVALQIDPITQQTLLPSTVESFDAITSGVSNLVNKVNALPLEDIAGNVNSLVKTANNKVNSIAIDKTMAHINSLVANADKKIKRLPLENTVNQFNAFLKEGRTLSSTAKSTFKKLNQSVSKISKTAEDTLDGYSADAPLYYNLNNTLTQLNETMSSLKTVLDMLERHPNSLVFGEDKPQEPQQFYWDKEKKQ